MFFFTFLLMSGFGSNQKPLILEISVVTNYGFSVDTSRRKSLGMFQHLLLKSINRIETYENGYLTLKLIYNASDLISPVGNHQTQGNH